MRTFLTGAALALAAGPLAAAELETRQAQGSVAEVADRLEAAVRGAGAEVFARVDHGAGAASVDMQLPDSQLLIFGNPQLGTPVMQEDIRAGLVLPLKMLVYADGDGGTRIAWREVEETVDDFDVDDDLDVLEKMEAALEKFADTAASP